MTLCIAAFDPLKQSVVAVADAMISTSDLTDSTEAPSLKIGVLSRKYNWLLMFAGDPSIWSSVRERAEAALADTDEAPMVWPKRFAHRSKRSFITRLKLKS